MIKWIRISLKHCNFLNLYLGKPWFSRVCSRSLLKTLSERRNCPLEKLSSIFIKFEIVICKLCWFGRV